MSLTRAFATVLAAIAVSDAFIDFDKSRLFDEKDFEGKDIVYVPLYCQEGCNIYVSVPEDSEEVAKNIFIDDFTGQQTNLFDANVKDVDNHKIPYVVPKASPQVNFLNKNVGMKSAPIAVWVVRGDAPLFGQAEVYDADGTTRAAAKAVVITILDAEPFTVSTFSNGKIFPYIAITAGFDALDSPDKCTRVIQEDTQDLRGLEVHSPLFTIGFQPSDTEISMLALKNSISVFDLTNMMYVSSPGYIGCYIKDGNDITKTFRSSLYGAKSNFEIVNDDPVPFRIYGDLTLDTDHPVTIVADDQAPITWNGRNDFPQASLTAKDLKISWTRNDADLNMRFMVRIEPDLDVKTTTTEADERTTTEELEPVKTTTAELEIKSTTVEPEEPVKTTTAEPEIKTTTVESQEEKTSTGEPEEPVRTTTLEPEEPVKTTTEDSVPEVKTTTLEPEEPIKTTTTEPITATTAQDEPDPVKTTTLEPVDPVKTTTEDSEPEPEKTTTSEPEPAKTTTKTRRTTSEVPKSSTMPYHPKSTTSMPTSTSTMTTTTSSAGYGSLMLSVVIASAVILA